MEFKEETFRTWQRFLEVEGKQHEKSGLNTIPYQHNPTIKYAFQSKQATAQQGRKAATALHDMTSISLNVDTLKRGMLVGVYAAACTDGEGSALWVGCGVGTACRGGGLISLMGMGGNRKRDSMISLRFGFLETVDSLVVPA